MIATQTDLFARLDEVRQLCPDMRIGQFLSTIGLLGEDDSGHNLWDIEDEEFAVAVERFHADLTKRIG